MESKKQQNKSCQEDDKDKPTTDYLRVVHIFLLVYMYVMASTLMK